MTGERIPKILVVDDDPRLRDLLRRYLGENGFQVFVSENGQAMNRLWVREHFDALILDLMMPGEDGLQILRRLRAAKDQTPVIMLTARGEDVDRIVGLELEGNAIPRHGYPVEVNGEQVGEITTGYRSISTGKSVAMAMINKPYDKLGTEVEVRIRKKTFPAKVVKKRFYDKSYKK